MNPSPSIGLDRDKFKCFLCPINEQSTVHCVIHPQQKAVLCTYLRNFTLIERRGSRDFFAISQNLHRQVYCPESAVCDKVRQLSLIFFSMGNEFFVVCERFKIFFCNTLELISGVVCQLWQISVRKSGFQQAVCL